MKSAVLSCALVAMLSAMPLAAAEDAEAPRLIAVSGSGEVTALPDRARLSLAVDAVNAEVKTAESQVNRVVRDFLAQAKSLGAKPEHLSSTAVSVQPEYVWDEKERQQKLIGYRARRDIQLLVTDLDKLGDYILKATEAGVNHVTPPVLESSRAAELEREALSRAATDAQAKAQVLAQTLGVTLGRPRTVRAGGQTTPPPVPYKVMSMRAEAAFDGGNQEMGLTTGEIRVNATADVEFDLVAK